MGKAWLGFTVLYCRSFAVVHCVVWLSGKVVVPPLCEPCYLRYILVDSDKIRSRRVRIWMMKFQDES